MVDKVGCLRYLEALIVGCLEGSVLKVDPDGEMKKKKGKFRFWIGSDTWRVSLYSKYLYISSILWNYIQDILG